MINPKPKKIKFKKSLISCIFDEGIYSPHDITYIHNLAIKKGYKTPRNTIYNWIVRGTLSTATHKGTIELCETYFRAKLRMCRSLHKKLNLK